MYRRTFALVTGTSVGCGQAGSTAADTLREATG
jgi:hypothetical protein